MTEKAMRKTIAISQLLVDTQNPRLAEPQPSQTDAIRAMAQSQGDKIVVLARHFVENGANPASLPIVMPSTEDSNMYYVLDGNRRLTALKLLESPDLSEGVLSVGNVRKIKAFSKEFHKNPIRELTCIVMPDRDSADKWIQLTHRGISQGAGLVEWDGLVAARYDSRQGNTPLGLQVLDFARAKFEFSGQTAKKIDQATFPITTLNRLINTPYVRQKLGIDKEEELIVTKYPADEVIKGIARIVEDLGVGNITVSGLKNLAQRIKYIDEFDRDYLPDPTTQLSQAYPLATVPTSETAGAKKTTKPKQGATGADRRVTLIPRGFSISISQHKIGRIFTELKRLSVDEFPNCGSVMLRVFLELSVDYYLQHTMGWAEDKAINSSLATKLGASADYMEKESIMTKDQLKPIRKAASGQTLVAASVKTFHAYVHSRYMSAIGSELKTAWDDLQPFVAKLWA